MKAALQDVIFRCRELEIRELSAALKAVITWGRERGRETPVFRSAKGSDYPVPRVKEVKFQQRFRLRLPGEERRK